MSRDLFADALLLINSVILVWQPALHVTMLHHGMTKRFLSFSLSCPILSYAESSVCVESHRVASRRAKLRQGMAIQRIASHRIASHRAAKWHVT